ncbi:MAG: undecaprenyl-diphosphate phosphatase [Spirochaetales bacterium]|nr:undecaprenyl-diphosphate phosphatase [Spirochaetales bacterium]
MTIIQAVILGAIQGVAEFLPVSSSGHLVVLKSIMSLQEVPQLFDIILHFATLFVVIIVFREIIIRLIKVLFRFLTRNLREEDGGDLRLIGIVLLASVFTAALGFAIEALDMGTHPKIVSGLFLLTAAILITTRFTHGTREYADLKVKDGVITGIAQGFAVFPGISRSGMTIAAALGVGMDRKKAGEFSFILSLPAILGALLLEVKDFGTLLNTVSPLVLGAGFISAFVVGLFSLILLLRLIRGGKLYLFSIYLIPLGLLGIIFL